MIVLLIFFNSIGMLGWIFNGLVRAALGVFPGLLFLGTLPLALVGGSLITSRATRLMGNLLPPISTTATRAQALVGRRGMVISPFVDQAYGMVHLRDAGGTLISVFAVTNAAEPIQRGDEVLLLSYDEAQKRYVVEHVAGKHIGV
jgi:membrane protein implicated in regulation of membrane protease activity